MKPYRSLARSTYSVLLVFFVLLLASCTTGGSKQHGGHPTASTPVAPSSTPVAPSSSMATTSAFPNITGVQFDQSLRNGHNSFPEFGRLLAASQTGAPATTTVDLSGVNGSVIGIYACKGSGKAPKISLKRGKSSLLSFWAGGCDPTYLYSGESQKIPAGDTHAKLTITAPKSIKYAFVLEQVATGKKTA